MRRLIVSVALVAVGGVVAGACSDYPVPPAESGGSATLRLQKISGDEQTGPPGKSLNDPYVVKVIDGNGGAVPGAVVRFRISQGEGGSLSSSRVVTDSAGNAAVTARLPDATSTSQTVIAEGDSIANAVSFTSETRAVRAGAANLRIVSGDGQKGITRDTLLDPLTVEVTDGEGVAMQDVAVKWKVISGDGGSVRTSPAPTADDGLARNFWRLGNAPGATDSVMAWIEPSGGEADTVLFTSQVTGVPDTIVITQGAIELDNNFKEPERVVGDTVFVAPEHWSRKPFKAIVRDDAGRTVRGATLSWTVTSRGGAVGDEPEDGDAETVKVFSSTSGGVTVWRQAAATGELFSSAPNDCFEDVDDDGEPEQTALSDSCWIGATLSMEQYPEVTPVTLDALVRAD